MSPLHSPNYGYFTPNSLLDRSNQIEQGKYQVKLQVDAPAKKYSKLMLSSKKNLENLTAVGKSMRNRSKFTLIYAQLGLNMPNLRHNQKNTRGLEVFQRWRSIIRTWICQKMFGKLILIWRFLQDSMIKLESSTDVYCRELNM